MIRKIVFLDDIERWKVNNSDKNQVDSWRLLLQNIVKIVRKLSGNKRAIDNYDAIDIVSYYGQKNGDNNEVIQIKKWKVTQRKIEGAEEVQEIQLQALTKTVADNLPEGDNVEEIDSIIFCDHVWEFFSEERRDIKDELWNEVKKKRCLLVFYTASDIDGALEFIQTIEKDKDPTIRCKLCKSVWSIAQDWADNINNVMATSSNLYNALSRSDIWN